MITLYVPTQEESDRFLSNVEKWVERLRKQHVPSDIAAYIARDFLAPMRIRPLDGDSPQNGYEPPNNLVAGQGAYIPTPDENAIDE